MAEEDRDSKTEEPTEKKLSQAREEGQVAQSQEIKSFFMFLAALLVVAAFAPWITRELSRVLRFFLENAASLPLSPYNLRYLSLETFNKVTLLLFMPFLIFMVVGVLGSIVQFGFIWAPKSLAPKMNKISPIAGAKRLFSKRSIVEGLKSILKLFLVSGAIFVLVGPHFSNPEVFMGRDVAYTMSDLYDLLVLLLIATCIIVGVIAIMDFLFQKYQFTQDQRMTKQEVRDEHKNMEGDPHVKARIRSLRMQRARQRMMAAVPEASVVVTNPTHYAVALKYEADSMAAPVLVAKGTDLIARKIRSLAEENGVPVVENPPLARALFASVELNQEVPPEHYKAVAEVIGYVMRLGRRRKPAAADMRPPGGDGAGDGGLV
ncbi:flagellar biosynthesis protein FlhB [Phaeovibrio sulfidiphilus]|uniref:Flagellar biosynthetic protein FlhB n=1 Tax=Phaeovibrio sulfidiphilus TaxID=1220600 RepID=A0A8J6YP83_9PROT|nr:flagellar biosynthesis protein FlhB [Phaeovibrio sulfidiphilus]MBE1237046.1 flagellar biosynthesis protein FlhB [Phaeovibrio sulfidiphilus]